MIIRPPAPVSTATAGGVRRRADGSRFEMQDAAPSQSAPAAARVESASLLMLQEGGEPVEDRAARRQGHEMLSALDGLHRALLGGGDGLASLDRLDQALARAPVEALDPGLREAVAAVRLRAMVERARYRA